MSEINAMLGPELRDAIEALIDDRVRAALDERAPGSATSPWLSIDEASEYVGVSRRSLEHKLKQGRIRSTYVGRRRLLNREDIDAWLGGGVAQ